MKKFMFLTSMFFLFGNEVVSYITLTVLAVCGGCLLFGSVVKEMENR